MTTLIHELFGSKAPLTFNTRSSFSPATPASRPREVEDKAVARMPAQNELFDDIPIDDVYYVDDGCAACMLGRVMLLTLAVFVAGVAWAIWG